VESNPAAPGQKDEQLSESKTETPPQASLGSERPGAFISPNRNAWLMRCLGAALLIAGWTYFTLPHFGSPRFFLDTLVFTALGAYFFFVAYNARRDTMSLEKRLRLGLIMRNMELESMATRDDLTHLFNRRHLFERFERELETARGFHRPLSVLVIDLNGMKAINDSHGHRVGDKVLAGFGRFLAEQARASDVPARIGGDEFAVILPDTAEQAARSAANRLLQALDKTAVFEENDITVKVTASVGVSGYPWAADTVDDIMHLADESMYDHKRGQRAPVAAAGAAASSDRSG